ncbi:hypothetical protein [Chitinophaga rhizosphaerae]|uniref:hypothetical protein n=1 Tax=Chitinophaga rhizosphaerae TaxID=1864947 RepID=UPI000F800685|nr:hypothetical protein [Chitinophaga rhizosphaerae]
MRRLILVSLICLPLLSAAQILQEIPGAGYIWQRGVFKQGLQLPQSSSSLSTIPGSPAGAIRWNPSLDSVQVWNGTEWVAVGTGGSDSSIDSIRVSNDTLYIRRPTGEVAIALNVYTKPQSYSRTELATPGQAVVDWGNVVKPVPIIPVRNGIMWDPTMSMLSLGYRSQDEVDYGRPSFEPDAAVILVDTGQSHSFYWITTSLHKGDNTQFVLDSVSGGFLSLQARQLSEEFGVGQTYFRPTSAFRYVNDRSGAGGMSFEHVSGMPAFGPSVSSRVFQLGNGRGWVMAAHKYSPSNHLTVRRSYFHLGTDSTISFGFSLSDGGNDPFDPSSTPILVVEGIGNRVISKGDFKVEKAVFSNLIHTGSFNYTVQASDYIIYLDPVTVERTLTLPTVSAGNHGRVLILKLGFEFSSAPATWRTSMPFYYSNTSNSDLINKSIKIQADASTGRWEVIP